MTPHADSIWKIADSMRGERFDVANLVRHVKEAGIPVGVKELLFILQRLGQRDGGEFFVPTDVAEFVAKLLEPASPKSLLDPWAGVGLLTLPLNQHLHLGRCEALSPNAAACEVFKLLGGSAGINIQCVDPLLALAQSPDRYDAVVGNTPFGMRGREPLVVQVGAEERKVSDDYGNLLILQSCLRLSENGLGVFIVPNSFFFASGGKGKARCTLEELGFRVTAAIELPAGTFHPLTSLTTHIVVLQKSTEAKLFTAKYVPDSKHQLELLKNLAARSEGKSPSLGRIEAGNTFRGFSAVEFAEAVQEQSRRMRSTEHPEPQSRPRTRASGPRSRRTQAHRALPDIGET
jgi:N-6 DNA Methylase